MYPRLSDVFSDLFGFELPFPIYSFGAMLAISILTAAWLLGKQMDWMYRNGRMSGVRVPVEPKGKEKGKGRKRAATKEASPAVLVGTITFLAVVMGVSGAKLFHVVDHWDRFVADPLGLIFSTGGLTFYGGLIIASLTIAWYVRKKGIRVRAFFEAVAPSLMIAYGLGRIGCYLAGDGDWGVCADLSAKPGWLPMFLWSETFPNNILERDLVAECAGGGVYPTMLYEVTACLILFSILWALRKHPFQTGWLFGLYLVFNGIERFLIETIRVNNRYDVLGLDLSQAQMISTGLVVFGLVIMGLTMKRRAAPKGTPAPDDEPVTVSSTA